jgi:hypothetical protein
VSMLVELGACTDRRFLWISCCDRWCCTVDHKLFPYVCGACGCWHCMSWRSAAVKDCSGEVNLEKNILPEDPFGAHCAVLLCSSPFTWLQCQYDSGWGFFLSARVKFQQLSVDSVFVFSGHSLCRWPPLHHKHGGDCLQLAQTWPNFGSYNTA